MLTAEVIYQWPCRKLCDLFPLEIRVLQILQTALVLSLVLTLKYCQMALDLLSVLLAAAMFIYFKISISDAPGMYSISVTNDSLKTENPK